MRKNRLPALLLALLLLPLAAPLAQAQHAGSGGSLQDPVEVTALAVAMTEDGQRVGSSATISVTVATGGSGHVFIDTRPLAGTDMQGSARIAARVAAGVTGHALEEHDLFFVVRSPSPIIAGPSAGGIMTLAAVVALQNAHLEPGEEPWELDRTVMSTGTIGPDGSIGPVGGIVEKAQAAANSGARLFLVPEGQGTYTPRQAQNGLLVEGETVEMGEHCQRTLGIECREVATIEDLVTYATGHRFQRDPVAAVPTTAAYNATMAPLSEQLVEDASAYQNVWARLNLTQLQPGAEADVQGALDQAHAMAQQARAHWRAQDYYSAASRAFSASIHGTHARLLLDFFEGGRSLDAVAEGIRNASGVVREAEAAAAAGTVTGMHTLYTVGAAQERVSDAEAHLASAWTRFNESDVNGALFDTAWAIERSATVHWWLSLSEPFGDGPALPVGPDELADEFITLADEMLAYTSSVLRLQGGPPSAAEQLSRAREDNRRGFHAAAVIEAAEAQVRAALAVEVQVAELTQDKLNASRDQAARAIHEARARGVEPVLAVAMFEFAGAQESRPVALEFYRTARVFAGFSNVLTGATEPTPSKFVGHYETSHTPTGYALPRSAYKSVALGWLTIGVFSTLALVVLGMALFRDGE